MITENHQREQYWFDQPTMAWLEGIVWAHERPLLLCCPMFGQFLHERGQHPPVLDVDDRFAHLPGFRRWDMYRPTPIDYNPDLIIVDPPFRKVKLGQLFSALAALRGPTTNILLAFPERRKFDVMGTLALFGMVGPVGPPPEYVSCSPGAAWFSNFELPKDSG